MRRTVIRVPRLAAFVIIACTIGRYFILLIKIAATATALARVLFRLMRYSLPKPPHVPSYGIPRPCLHASSLARPHYDSHSYSQHQIVIVLSFQPSSLCLRHGYSVGRGDYDDKKPNFFFPPLLLRSIISSFFPPPCDLHCSQYNEYNNILEGGEFFDSGKYLSCTHCSKCI